MNSRWAYPLTEIMILTLLLPFLQKCNLSSCYFSTGSISILWGHTLADLVQDCPSSSIKREDNYCSVFFGEGQWRTKSWFGKFRTKDAFQILENHEMLHVNEALFFKGTYAVIYILVYFSNFYVQGNLRQLLHG